MANQLYDLVHFLVFSRKKKFDNTVKSIEEFFENGISFPQLISLLYDIEQIPNICKSPKNIFQKKTNNEIALDFLFKKNDFIQKCRPSLNSHQERIIMLYCKYPRNK